MRVHLATAATAALTSLPIALAAPSVELIPEYAPVQAVLISEELFSADYHASELLAELAAAHAEPWIVTAQPRSPAAIDSLLAEAGVKLRQRQNVAFFDVPHSNLWIRDFGPLMLAERGPGAAPLSFVDLRFDGAATVNDDFPRRLGKRLQVPTSYLPLQIDGGNLLTAGDFCFTGAANVASKVGLDPGPQALATRHRAALGCKKVLIVRDPPHEHVDMWAKVVADDTVLVNELSVDTLRLVETLYGHIPADLAALKQRLDGGARQLADAGLKVERLPMPLPYRGAFRTFANAVLINGTAIVPSFKRYGWNYDDYPDIKLEANYEAQVKHVYEKHGFRVRSVNADGLIFNGGGFHCVLLQLPALLKAPLNYKGH